MAITQIIATLPAVLNDSATFYEDIAERNNSLVTTILPSINAWATQANTTQTEINAKALQVAAQAVDGGYSQDYINTNFIGVNNAQNITAVKTFTVSPIVPTPTTTGNVITMGNIIQKTAIAIGYGAGSGGSVTQLTSKSTAVTLNKPTGQIIMNNAALAAGASVTFTFNNSLLIAEDLIGLTMEWNLTTSYRFEHAAVGVGSSLIRVTNISGISLSEAVQIKFSIIKGAVA